MCWATNFALLKFGVEHLDAGSGPLFVATRFFLASGACLPFVFQASEPGVLWAGARIGGWCAFGYAAQVLAEDTFGAAASTTAFLCSLQTVVVAGICLLGKNCEHRERTMSAVAVAIAGVAVLCFGGSEAVHFQPGDLIALGQAGGFGISYLELEAAIKKYPDDAKPLAAIQCVVVGVFAVLASAASVFSQGYGMEALTSFATQLVHSPEALSAVLWMGFISTAFTIYLQTEAFKKCPASDASIILVTEPLWAFIVAHFLLGENLSGLQCAGGLAVLSACALNDGLFDNLLFSKNKLSSSSSS